MMKHKIAVAASAAVLAAGLAVGNPSRSDSASQVVKKTAGSLAGKERDYALAKLEEAAIGIAISAGAAIALARIKPRSA